MNEIPCRRCGHIKPPSQWCGECTKAGRLDRVLIATAIQDAYMQGINLDGRVIDHLADRVYDKLRFFDRLPEPTPASEVPHEDS